MLFLLTLRTISKNKQKKSFIMDRNSIIGYVLIGLVLVGYFYFIQPNPQQIEAQKHYQDSFAAAQYEKEQAMARELQQREKELLEQGKDCAWL